jgi:hypothetical protein
MTAIHFIRIARELSVCVLTVAVLFSVWGGADKQRKATILQSGMVEFTPNRRSFWAWPILMGYLIYATISQVMRIQRSPLNLMTVLPVGFITFMVAALAISFPAKIIVSNTGLEQVSWLWKNKRIRWGDIIEINTGEKSRTVTITGADGTKIVHGRELPDRPRLLIEIKKHCGQNLPPGFPRESLTDLQEPEIG